MPHEITLEVLLSREVCRLLDTFAAAMNIPVVFFSRQGKILKRGRSYGNTPYCTLMQEQFFGIENASFSIRKCSRSVWNPAKCFLTAVTAI